MSASLRDAFLTALVALGLFGPMVGLLTAPTDRGLALIPRPLPVAALVAAAFVGRLGLLAWRASANRRTERRSLRTFAEQATRASRYLAPALLVAALVLPALVGRYYLDLGV